MDKKIKNIKIGCKVSVLLIGTGIALSIVLFGNPAEEGAFGDFTVLLDLLLVSVWMALVFLASLVPMVLESVDDLKKLIEKSNSTSQKRDSDTTPSAKPTPEKSDALLTN